MTIHDFAEFYAAAHPGKLPFPWQERLVEQLLRGEGWPSAITVPTSSGKTSVLDAAVFSLAAQAGVSALDRTAPLRMFFVVDRRLVVDDVTRHAQEIKKAVCEGVGPILEAIRERLKRFGAACPLEVATLRGGMYLNNRWADSPNQPLICVSTVDQTGSRLLFRGYGVTPGRRPVDAALVANDSLIVLDEAHLSNPFKETLKNVQRYQSDEFRETQFVRPLQFVEMSATTREAGANRIELEDADYAHPLLGSRLQASKTAVLIETTQLELDAAEAALRLQSDAQVIGVVMNTVASARAVFEQVRSRATDADAILLTGRVRPYDRDDLILRYLNRMKAGRAEAQTGRLFVVATQTIEVGADLDFEALVTESAPLDSLRQRFGRLDRLGNRGSTNAVILKPKRDEPLSIYGESLNATWDWLTKRAVDSAGRKTIDFGAFTIGRLFGEQGDASLLPKPKRAPILFPTHLDTWVQTNPSPAPDPDVAPFLHGRDALDAADVQIVWRRDLPENFNVDDWIDTVSMLPPTPLEALPIPVWTFRNWIGGGAAPVTDIEAVDEPEESDDAQQVESFLIWRGPKSELTSNPRRVKPGDTVVVRTTVGGTDEFGWAPGYRPSLDIGDECSEVRAQSGRGESAIRRSRPQILDEVEVDDSDPDEQIDSLFRAIKPEIQRVEGYQAGVNGEFQWFIGRTRQKRLENSPPTIAEEEPEDDGMSLTGEITLLAHTNHVEKKTRNFLLGCGINGTTAQAVEIAAKLHDFGKSDDRFQLMLALSGANAKELLGKGRRGSQRNERDWRREAGYPSGARHEFASLALAKQYQEWPSEEVRDLALYLIATHHGYGRAMAPSWNETADINVPAFHLFTGSITAKDAARFAKLGSGWTDHFWRINRKFGWWGTAYLEAILRRADCEASREEGERR